MYIDKMIRHHNDGKGKWESHEVYVKDPYIAGYGDTKEQAYAAFIVKFDKYLVELLTLRRRITIDTVTKVDCLGETI